MDTVISILRYLPLPNLSELEVTFPITHDFGRFFPNKTNSLQIPIGDILQHLRHLGLHVRAYTGFSGPEILADANLARICCSS